METIETVIKTPKEATELGLALAKLVVELKAAFSDGIGPDDIPKLISLATASEILKGIEGLDKLGAEWGSSKEAFVAAFLVAGMKISEGMK